MKQLNINKVVTDSTKIQIKESAIGVYQLAAIVAESVASYVLYFSGQSLSLKIVAGALLVDAALRATRTVIVRK